jgi:hypothetical protein
MAVTTPDEWLPILSKRLDDRYPRMVLLRSYASDKPPLPEMGQNVRASWIAFQRKACTNYGELAISSLGGRIKFNGIRVGESSDTPAAIAARRVWRDNRMGIVVADAIENYLTCGVAYLVTGLGSDGAVVASEDPEQSIAAPDPLRPWKARAYLKVWRDSDAGNDYAYVYAAGLRQKYVRSSFNEKLQIRASNAGAWIADGPVEVYAGDPPVVILERKNGVGFLEPHLSVIDRINLGKLQRLVITAMQAFRQRGLKGGLPTEDEDGNQIDFKEVFSPAPGALWDIPEGIDVWESQVVDLTPLLAGEKTDARDFAAVTRTPVSALVPDGANQSAEGAAAAKEGQIAQAEKELERLRPAIEVAIVYALRAEGIDLGSDTVELLNVPPAHVSLSERYDAASKALAVQSRKTIQRDILGMSPQQIAEDEADMSLQQLQAFTLTGGASGNA